MKKIIIIIIFVILLIFGFGYYSSNYKFTINEQTIIASKINDSYNGLKIVQFSDMLISSENDIKNINSIVDSINNLNPDIVVFTGDLVSSKYTLNNNTIELLTLSLKRIEPKQYKYSIIGDNDKSIINIYKEIMENSNFILLDNSSTYLFYKDIQPIQLIGLTDISNIDNAIKNEDDITPTYKIVITHYPDYIDSISNYDIDLILAGHSLNGQIILPFIGGLIKKDGATKYIDSYYEINNTKMYISSGIGKEKMPIRLFNKPEINLYKLEK